MYDDNTKRYRDKKEYCMMIIQKGTEIIQKIERNFNNNIKVKKTCLFSSFWSLEKSNIVTYVFNLRSVTVNCNCWNEKPKMS